MALDCTSQAPARTEDRRGFKRASDRTVTESATNRVISKVDEITSLLRALASRERPSAKVLDSYRRDNWQEQPN
jgi:hypothetical protein